MSDRMVLLGILVSAIAVSHAAGQAATSETGDGLSLALSAKGRITGLRIGRTDLPLRGEGGFAIADFHHQPEAENLIPNPGFEQGAAGWRLGKGQSLDTEIFHSGRASVRLEVPGPAPGSSNVGCLIPVKANTRYRVSMWVRRQNVGVCGAYVSERDDKNRLTGKRTQVGAAIAKKDGVWLPLTWELVTQPETTRLSVRADIYKSTGTLWLDDFSLIEANEAVYQPVIGRIERKGENAAFRSRLPQAGLELEATFTGTRECVRVEGVVRDTTGEDRAVGVRFGLPLDLAGWTWYTDAEERQSVEVGGVYRHTYRCKSGIGVCSIYPWAALSGPRVGLSLALPLSQGPRVFILQHDQRALETSLTFYFGLSRDAGNNPSRAPFSFVIYRHDPQWGMRSAMERYYRLFPESFVKRPTYEGYLNYANLERFDPKTHRVGAYGGTVADASDFGEGYRFVWAMHGCYDFRMVPYDDPKKPEDEVVLSLLKEMVQAETKKPRGYASTSETIKKIVYDSDGKFRYIGDTRYWRPQEGYNHTDKAGWGFNFRVNEDPGVSDYLAGLTRRRLENYAQDKTRRPFDAWLTADAIEGYFCNKRGLNYRREHFKTTLMPLTFGAQNLKVAMHNTIWDFHHKCWWPISQEFKVLTHGNSNGYEQAFTTPYVDIPMTEGNWDRNHPGRLDRYMRAIAHHKIWRYWRVWHKVTGAYGEEDPASVRAHFRRGLAYAIFPCMGCLRSSTGNIEPYRSWFRQYVPAIEELSAAGWEPVPYARASEGVIVERYGSFAHGELHFTLRNYAQEAKDVAVTLEKESLGIPQDAALCAADIVPRSPAVAHVPDTWRVALEADGTRAFWVGTRGQAAQHGFRLAAATLAKIERMFATELNGPGRQALAQAVEVTKRGSNAEPVDALSLAENIHRLAADIEGNLKTKSPIDLAKLLFRLRADVSLVPVALVGAASTAERVREGALRGETARVVWRLSNKGEGNYLRADINAVETRVLSPWPEVAKACEVAPHVEALNRGHEVEIRADLFVPADPPRGLMPYLLEVRGKVANRPFTIVTPVDLVAVHPLEVAVAPERVVRGQERRLMVTVTNRLKQGGRLRLTFAAPPKAKMTPTALALDVPPQGAAAARVTISVGKFARLGRLRIPYTIMGDSAKFKMNGFIELKVFSGPLLRVNIKRVGTAPRIDGRLGEAEWQRQPTIAELRVLSNAGPATEKTAVWAAYGDKGLYVAMRCSESQMDKLQAKFTDRGAPLYKDDDVEIFILTRGAGPSFQFAINALGARSDNFGNRANWLAAARRLDNAWTVEVFIPYSAIRVAGPPRKGSSWAMQFGRQQKPKRETTSWTPGRAFNVPEGFGEVVFE